MYICMYSTCMYAVYLYVYMYMYVYMNVNVYR